MTGCVHALDILASPKCTAGVDADEDDSFPGSAAENAHGRAHNGLDPRACNLACSVSASEYAKLAGEAPQQDISKMLELMDPNTT